MKELWQITTSYFCCGILIKKGVCVDAAPIMGWAKGKTLGEIKAWVLKKKGTIELVNIEEESNEKTSSNDGIVAV
jgi:hypothetical protein